MKYSTIYYGSKFDRYPACTRITYSEQEHKQAMRDIRDSGYYIHGWQ